MVAPVKLKALEVKLLSISEQNNAIGKDPPKVPLKAGPIFADRCWGAAKSLATGASLTAFTTKFEPHTVVVSIPSVTL